MTNQKPNMPKGRKEFPRAEMLACAKEARFEKAHGRDEIAKMWNDFAAKRLAQLGGLAARW